MQFLIVWGNFQDFLVQQFSSSTNNHLLDNKTRRHTS